MSDKECIELFEISQRWAARICPVPIPSDVPVKRLPKSSYDGDNPYNGFTGQERRTGDQVLQVLRRTSIIEKPRECDLCGSTTRIGFHGEDYFNSAALLKTCFPCHMALHRRFKSPAKWFEKLEKHSDRPMIDDLRSLPMQEINFANWLRQNTDGPHDVVKRVWPNRNIEDYKPRPKRISKDAKRYINAIQATNPSDTEMKLLSVLAQNPDTTSALLTRKMGWRGQSAWHLKFGRFCRRLEPSLGLAPTTKERSNKDGDPEKFYIGLLATFDDNTRGFCLLPSVTEAVLALS